MSYNGLTNYETWAVNLWLSNEVGSQNYWDEVANKVFSQVEEGGVLTKSENARYALMEIIKDSHNESNPLIHGESTIYSDLLQSAMDDVNWSEIANTLLEDVEGYQPANFSDEEKAVI